MEAQTPSVLDASLRALSVLAPSASTTSAWPSVVLVDAGAAALVRAVGGAMALIALLGCSTVAPIDSTEDVLCQDLGGARLVTVLLASPLSDALAALVTRLKTAPRDCEVRIASWFAVTPADLRLLESRTGLASSMQAIKLALAVVPGPHHACEFALSSGPCPAPTLARLGLPRNTLRASVLDIDPDDDLSPQYKARLKATALALDGALAALGLNVAGAVHALGLGAQLVANTVHAHLTPPQHNRATPASLIVVDRSLDWASAIDVSEASLASLARLHDQLVATDQADEVLRQVVDAVAKGSLERRDGLLLALRAASLGGSACAFSPTALGEFAGVLGEHCATVVRDAATARAEAAPRWAGALRGALVGRLVADVCDSNVPLDYLHRAGGSALKHVARASMGLLSRFGVALDVDGGDDVVRQRPTLVVFVLGGVASADVEDAVAARGSSGGTLLVGGSSVLDAREDVFQDAFGTAKDLANVFAMG